VKQISHGKPLTTNRRHYTDWFLRLLTIPIKVIDKLQIQKSLALRGFFVCSFKVVFGTGERT
jgi:hypothetical protein